MSIFLNIAISLLAASSIFAEKRDVCSGGDTEIHPSTTIYEKGEEYVKFIGPIYGKVEWNHGIQFPMRISQEQDVYFALTPTREIYAMFAIGKVSVNGVQIAAFDGEDDMCMTTEGLCPMFKCRPLKEHYLFNLKSSGLLPGIYSGNISLYSYNEHYEKYHVIGLTFNLHLLK